MIKRYVFEMVVGVITLASVLLFGPVGYASFSLMALLAFFSKKKPDERELQLFYKAGNLTMGLMIISLVIIDQLKNATFGPVKVGDYWLSFATAAFLVSHGASGLVYTFRE
jgi:hypothetical protein